MLFAVLSCVVMLCRSLCSVPHLPANTPGDWYPRGWPWYTFQWCLYSNLVRYISFLQICVMLPAAVLYDAYPDGTGHEVANFLLILLLVDLSALVCFGPSPWSPSGTLSTYFMWKVRGNATSSIPYKVVWAVYLITLIPLLAEKKYGDMKVALLGLIFNSALLVVLRF